MSESMGQKLSAMGNKEKVAKIINSVLEKVSKAEEISRETIYHELLDVQCIIEDMRKQVGMSGVGDINNSHIPGATDELDAVVAATATASGAIMDSCDVIMEKAGEIGGANGDAVIEQVTKIYEACSFQDITGQRITKVIKTLKDIEQKIDMLVSSIADKMPVSMQKAKEEKTFEQSLLNGPQLPDKGISQADIDKLLEDFD